LMPCQHGFFAVGKVDVFELDVRVVGVEHFRRDRFGHGIFRGEQFKDAFAGGAGLNAIGCGAGSRF